MSDPTQAPKPTKNSVASENKATKAPDNASAASAQAPEIAPDGRFVPLAALPVRISFLSPFVRLVTNFRVSSLAFFMFVIGLSLYRYLGDYSFSPLNPVDVYLTALYLAVGLNISYYVAFSYRYYAAREQAKAQENQRPMSYMAAFNRAVFAGFGKGPLAWDALLVNFFIILVILLQITGTNKEYLALVFSPGVVEAVNPVLTLVLLPIVIAVGLLGSFLVYRRVEFTSARATECMEYMLKYSLSVLASFFLMVGLSTVLFVAAALLYSDAANAAASAGQGVATLYFAAAQFIPALSYVFVMTVNVNVIQAYAYDRSRMSSEELVA